MYTILITTSGTGSRLGALTSHTNKSLIKIGDKYALSYIIDNYPCDSHFVITIGYYGDLVKDFLTLAYPTHNFTFVEIDKYEGEGSSLGYSMLQARSYLQTPFIFHCCDTITLDAILPNDKRNILYVAKNLDYHSYSSITVEGEYVKQMYMKGYKENDYIYTGLAYFYDFHFFWEHLEHLYKTNPQNMSLSDVHSICEMITSAASFKYQVLETYHDTGNLAVYNQTVAHFKPSYSVLEKENENLCFLEGHVIKYINNAETNAKRVKRTKYLGGLTPKIHGHSANFLSMELIKGVVASEVSEYGTIGKLLDWGQENLWVFREKEPRFVEACMNFYEKKTYERLRKIPFDEKNIVNGLAIGSVYDLLKKVDFKGLATDEFTHFHGDFILDNIIQKEDGSFVLLDWRESFDTELEYGDMYYDLAKLHHNIIFNHKNITSGLYTIENVGDEVLVDLKCNYFLMKQLEDYNRFILKHNYNMEKIRILTALIWLNMAPLYDGRLREFLFYFGKFHLYMAVARP